MPKPVLSLDAVRVRRTPVYQEGRVVGFASQAPPEVRGTLYFRDGSTMKLLQTLNDEEWRELEALLERASARLLALMTTALNQEEAQDLPPRGE